jgi:hypothetical protein
MTTEHRTEEKRAKAKKYYAGREIGILKSRVETLQLERSARL